MVPLCSSLAQRTARLTLHCLCAVFVFATFVAVCAAGALTPHEERTVAQWLERQSKIQTWSAEFTQTRTLKALAAPLTSQGRVWFSAPNLFRWELGNPAQTIALRQPDQMLVIYPKLKRAERYPSKGKQAGQWGDVLALLEAGFPRSKEDLANRFRIVAVTTTNDVAELTLHPASAAARRMIPQLKIGFGTNDLMLRSTEMKFADGSILRNDFTNTVLNPSLEQQLFEVNLGADYKIVEPMAR